MTNINVTMENGHVSIDIAGHAGYAPYGQDIVCSAISAIVQTAILGLEAIAEQYPNNVKIDIK